MGFLDLFTSCKLEKLANGGEKITGGNLEIAIEADGAASITDVASKTKIAATASDDVAIAGGKFEPNSALAREIRLAARRAHHCGSFSGAEEIIKPYLPAQTPQPRIDAPER